MIQPETWKAIHGDVWGAWSVVGPLVGVLIGAYITNRNQHKHWVADSKKTEYRELLSTLTRAYSTIVYIGSQTTRTGVEEQKSEQLRLESLNVISDRIFIAKEVKELHVSEVWGIALMKFEQSRDWDEFGKTFDRISKGIVARAEQIMD